MITYEVLMWALAFIGWFIGAAITVVVVSHTQPWHLSGLSLNECFAVLVLWPILVVLGLVWLSFTPLLMGLRGISRFVDLRKRKKRVL